MFYDKNFLPKHKTMFPISRPGENHTTPIPPVVFEYLLFKGALYNLAPATMVLSLIVLVHNVIIILHYFDDRARFVPSLFMGIAISDILKAQGDLVLAVISILVFRGHLDIMVLYNSIFFYTVTSLPGVNCSKILNMVLTFSFTRQIVNPFNRITVSRWRKVVLSLCTVITLLHISDTISVILLHVTYLKDASSPFYEMLYLVVAALSPYPGMLTLSSLACLYENLASQAAPTDGYFTVCSTVYRNKHFSLDHDTLGYVVVGVGVVLVFLPILLLLICIIVQITHLRRTFQGTETSPLVPNPTRHVSITICLISALFSLCHLTYFLLLIASYFTTKSTVFHHGEEFGVFMGFSEITLSLIYAVVYPIIIISRRQHLRERYLDFFRFFWARLRCSS